MILSDLRDLLPGHRPRALHTRQLLHLLDLLAELLLQALKILFAIGPIGQGSAVSRSGCDGSVPARVWRTDGTPGGRHGGLKMAPRDEGHRRRPIRAQSLRLELDGLVHGGLGGALAYFHQIGTGEAAGVCREEPEVDLRSHWRIAQAGGQDLDARLLVG